MVAKGSGEIFLHALARFRSAVPVVEASRWNASHGFDLALALRKAYWKIEGELPKLGIVWRSANGARTVASICIVSHDEPVDLFGRDLIGRLEQGEFEDDVSFELATFDFAELEAALVACDFFFDYLGAPLAWQEGIEEGILAAADELTQPA